MTRNELADRLESMARGEGAVQIADILEAAAALLDVGDGWRSIETAPKGTTVLGIVDGDVRLIHWCKTSHVPIYGWNLADQGVEDFDICHPTLWQPLPPPPKATPSGDEG